MKKEIHICDRCGKSFNKDEKIFDSKYIFSIRKNNIDLCEQCKKDLFLFLFGYELEGVKFYTPIDRSYLKVLYDTMYNPNTNEIEEGWGI